MKKLDKIVNMIDEALIDARNGDNYDDSYCCAHVKYGEFAITGFCDKHCREVEIYNHKSPDRCYPNLEEWLSKNIIEYDEIEIEPPYDYWNEHGFRNEADYINWRYR